MEGLMQFDRNGNSDDPASVNPLIFESGLPVMTSLDRYAWLAPYVLNCRGVIGYPNGTIEAHCPAHRDRKRSLYLRVAYGLGCSAGCTHEAMLKALNVVGGPGAEPPPIPRLS